MAEVYDYINKEFGDFRIDRNIGSGKEAEVFLCQHITTGRYYVLRLSIADDLVWDGKPLIPPVNFSIERANAQGSWLLNTQFAKGRMHTIGCTPIYGVLDNRYLVPVSSPVRVKSSWDVDMILKASPSDDLFLFELWEDIVLSMIAGAYGPREEPDNQWKTNWEHLIGGKILIEAMKRYLEGSGLSRQEKDQVIKNISVTQFDGPEFAENLLLRLCGCVSRNRMTLEEARATLQCFYFRINVTGHDLDQIIAAYKALLANTVGMETSILLLNFVLNELTKKPLDEYDNPEHFEIRTIEPDTSRFQLFIQEHAGLSQDVLYLEES